MHAKFFFLITNALQNGKHETIEKMKQPKEKDRVTSGEHKTRKKTTMSLKKEKGGKRRRGHG